jgi:hypothetical protein
MYSNKTLLKSVTTFQFLKTFTYGQYCIKMYIAVKIYFQEKEKLCFY